MQTLVSWLGRKALLYVAIVVAILFATLVLPHLSTWLQEDRAGNPLTLAETKKEIEADWASARATLDARAKDIRGFSRSKLEVELEASKAKLARAQTRADQPAGFFDSVRPGRILKRKQLELSIAYLEQEIAGLQLALSATGARERMNSARGKLERYAQVPTMRAIQVANQRCVAARRDLSVFRGKSRPERGFRNWWNEEAKLTAVVKSQCSRAKQLADRRATGLRLAEEYRVAAAAWAKAREWKAGQMEEVSKDLGKLTLVEVLRKAVVALVIILLTPYLIRLLFYFVFAPAAERRGAIRLNLGGGAGERPSAADASSTSVALRLTAGEELLVRQDYLQSTSLAGPKATQWFLDWRRPFTSLASGLVFLTRVRGEAETTTVSAVRDPFAEVTTLVLPGGASCVLHPRAIAAVVQPLGKPLRVTSHWRIASLNAWLTLQLRYLAFHGPARLVIKGGRGVRVERAERGRIFGQDQLVGFSADLAYSVTRNETFWPYFLGREPLFRDRVEAGGGFW